MVSEQDVLQSLAAYGAPLASTEPSRTLALEEALVEGLKLSHRNAVVFRTLPIVLLKNQDSLDWRLVKKQAAAANESRALGLMVDLTSTVAGRPELRRHVDELRVGDEDGTEYYFPVRSRYDRASAELRSPEVARRWGYFLNTTEESLRTLLFKFLKP